MTETPDWAKKSEDTPISPQIEEDINYEDFLLKPPTHPTVMPGPILDFETDLSERNKEIFDFWHQPSGKMYLNYGDSNSGKTFVSSTWFDNQCTACQTKIISPEIGEITECPACGSKEILARPIVNIDFELGRAEAAQTETFPHKNLLICEPRVLNVDYDPLQDDDATDVIATEETYINFLMTLYRNIKAGKVFPSCIITDSATEVWSIIQEWGFQELIRNHPKYTEANAKMMRMENQMDWKIPNNRHFKLIQICRAIMRHGVDIIWTARYEGPPSYVKDGTQKIRAQKDVSFYSDIRIHMEHRVVGEGPTKQNHYTSHIEKLGSLDAPVESFDRLNWVKIQKIYAEEKKKREASLSDEIEFFTP